MTMQRRRILEAAGLVGLGGLGGLASLAHADDDHRSRSRSRTTPAFTPLAAPARPKARVVVVGGGMAGATAAKCLRLWGDAVDVTLVDAAPHYTSCILSSLVLTGQRTMSQQVIPRTALASNYGVRLVTDTVRAIDPVRASVTLSGGTTLAADRLVLAPDIEFDDMTSLGLTDPDAMPHAWKAGPQTALLAQQLAAMPPGGTVIMTVPLAPYRCPPGPYERACLIADWLRLRKPGSRLVLLDANADIVAERDNFMRAFTGVHAGVIDYRPGTTVQAIDTGARTLSVTWGGGASATLRGDVINLIPRQRAPRLLQEAGLLNATGGRFAGVNVLSYEHTAAPRVHVIGDASATTQPKAGHIANQEAKVMADAIVRAFGGGAPDPAPVTNSACYSTITMKQASWLHALYQYDPATRAMAAVAAATGASDGWNGDHFEDMLTWADALAADSFR